MNNGNAKITNELMHEWLEKLSKQSFNLGISIMMIYTVVFLLVYNIYNKEIIFIILNSLNLFALFFLYFRLKKFIKEIKASSLTLFITYTSRNLKDL